MHLSYPGDLLVHLASFTAVLDHSARPGAFDAAARELAVDRSVLRRRLQTLAEWVGDPLLEGRGTRMAPTRVGRALAERAAALLRLAGTLRDDTAAQSPELVVGCTGTIATELLPDVLVRAARDRRGPRVIVRRLGGGACVRMALSGEIDVGIARAEDAPHATRLCADKLWLLVPARHPLARRRKVSLAALEGSALVLYAAGSRTRARVMERLAERGCTIAVEVEGKAAAIEYVRRGIGLGFVSAVPWHTPRARGLRAIDVTAHFPRTAFHLVVAESRATAPHVARFVALIRAEVGRRSEA